MDNKVLVQVIIEVLMQAMCIPAVTENYTHNKIKWSVVKKNNKSG